jgi:hypothetical protein
MPELPDRPRLSCFSHPPKENRGVPHKNLGLANSFGGSWLLVFSFREECEIIKSQITNQKSEIPRCPNFPTSPFTSKP